MPQLTGKQILAALMKEPEYSAMPEQILAAMEPFMLALPEVLKDLLDTPVTMRSIMDSKLIFLRYCMANDYVKKTMTVTEVGPAGKVFKVDSMAGMMQSMLESVIEMLDEATKDIPALLRAQGLTEDQMMAHPKGVGLKPDLLKRYRTGSLTIADLLVKQPMVIIKNTN